MSNTKQLGIGYGYFNPTISEQLTAQGFLFDEEKAKYFEESRQALLHLGLHNLITNSLADKTFQKLQKQIASHVQSKLITL
jgi:hypothetical protein